MNLRVAENEMQVAGFWLQATEFIFKLRRMVSGFNKIS
jgi:hypothetical protein